MQKIFNIIFFPLRCLFPNNEYISFLPITPLANERFDIIIKYLDKGYLLDVGCGDNRLVKEYRKKGGKGIGMDITPNKHADLEVKHTEKMNFSDNTFDDVTIIATLNHIPTREKTLEEVYRCLKPGGRVFITNLSPFIGRIGHKLWHVLKSDLDLGERGEMQEGELYGLKNIYIRKLLKQIGFVKIYHKKFSFGLNNLFIAYKPNKERN